MLGRAPRHRLRAPLRTRPPSVLFCAPYSHTESDAPRAGERRELHDDDGWRSLLPALMAYWMLVLTPSARAASLEAVEGMLYSDFAADYEVVTGTRDDWSELSLFFRDDDAADDFRPEPDDSFATVYRRVVEAGDEEIASMIDELKRDQMFSSRPLVRPGWPTIWQPCGASTAGRHTTTTAATRRSARSAPSSGASSATRAGCSTPSTRATPTRMATK